MLPQKSEWWHADFFCKRVMKKIFLTICTLLVLFSCERASNFLLTIEIPYVKNSSWCFKSNESVIFRISSRNNDSPLNRIKMTAYDKQYGLRAVMDSVVSGQSVTIDCVWQMPNVSDTTQISLDIQAFADNGQQTSFAKKFYVIPSNSVVTSIDGLSFYSAKSGKQDAFSLSELASKFSVTAADESIDIYDCSADTTLYSATSDTLSCEWKSKNGLQFGRFQNFNYGEATYTSIQQAYALSSSDNSIRGISNDDVILIGRNGDAIGVIKVVAVYDEEGVANDRYLFSVKLIKP